MRSRESSRSLGNRSHGREREIPNFERSGQQEKREILLDRKWKYISLLEILILIPLFLPGAALPNFLLLPRLFPTNNSFQNSSTARLFLHQVPSCSFSKRRAFFSGFINKQRSIGSNVPLKIATSKSTGMSG
jgi:hypothetical protein